MKFLRSPPVRARVAAACCFTLAAVLGGSEGASASEAPVRTPPLEAEPARQAPCPPGVVALETAWERSGDALLSGRDDILLRRLDAFRVPHPERFRLRFLDPFRMTGIFSDGCPFALRLAGGPGPNEMGQIRFLGPLDSLDRNHAYLRLPRPQPSRSPSFEGYRQVMSSARLGGLSYLGLWHRVDGSGGSLVAYYEEDGAPVTVLGTSRRTYDGVYYFFAVHQFMFTLVDEPEGSQPLYIATFERVPPADCCRRNHRRHRR